MTPPSPVRAGTRIAAAPGRRRARRPCRRRGASRRRLRVAVVAGTVGRQRRRRAPGQRGGEDRSPAITPGSSAARWASVPNSAIGQRPADDAGQVRARGATVRPTCSSDRGRPRGGRSRRPRRPRAGRCRAGRPWPARPRRRRRTSSGSASISRRRSGGSCSERIRSAQLGDGLLLVGEGEVHGAHAPGHAGHADAEQGDEVALDLVDAAAEGEDERSPGRPARCGRPARRRATPGAGSAAGPSTSIRSR